MVFRQFLAGVCLILAGLPTYSVTADTVPWSDKVRVGSGGSGIVGTGDFNADGFNDVAYAVNNGFVWYAGPNFESAIEHRIGDGSGRSYGGTAIDMNADGWTDLVVSDGAVNSGPGRLWLFLHPGSAEASTDEWTRIEIWNQPVWHQNDLKVADLDGDGRLDVVVRTRTDNLRVLVGLQNSDITAWTTRAWPTGETANTPEGLGLGDVDHDGENEIVLSGVYWDNPGGWRTGNPVEYIVDSAFVGKAVKSVVADLDNDGHSDDIVMSKAEGGGDLYLAWYRHSGNPEGGESAWSKSILLDNISSMHALEVADIDGDGLNDIFAGNSFSNSGLYLFYGTPDASVWTQQIIDSQAKQYVVSINDLDGDGDLDFVGPEVWQGPLYAFFNEGVINPPTEPPAAPSSLTATPLSDSSIQLNWQDNADNESGFLIERRLPSGDFALAGQTIAESELFIDGSLPADTVFDYRIFATNSIGSSEPSNIATAQTNEPPPPDETPPSVPMDLAATFVGFNQVALSWSGATDNVAVTGYRVFQDGLDVQSTSQSSTVVAALEPQTSYQFSVSAYDAAGNESTPGPELLVTTPPAPQLSDSIVALYLLDQSDGVTAFDETGNHPGAFVGSPQWLPQGGQYQGALSFAGATDGVALGTVSPAPQEQLTLAMWVNVQSVEGLASEARFISKADGTADSSHYWMVGNYLDGTALRFRLKTDNGGTTTLISDTGVLTTGTWTHVAATYDGVSMRLYRDGSEVASTDKTGPITTSDVPAAIGNQPAGAGDRGLVGWLDEVVIVDTALTQPEISQIMGGLAGLGSSEPDAPSNLILADVTNLSATISWLDNADNETGYRIERAFGNDDFLEIAVVADNVSTYTDSPLNGDTLYRYRVRAFNAQSTSMYSNVLEVATPCSDVSDCDFDGVPGNIDNCVLQVNPEQLDSDGDGIGNFCDPDFNNDCVVNFLDVAYFTPTFLGSDPLADLNGDGVVNFQDYIIVTQFFMMPPGPSGLPNACGSL